MVVKMVHAIQANIAGIAIEIMMSGFTGLLLGRQVAPVSAASWYITPPEVRWLTGTDKILEGSRFCLGVGRAQIAEPTVALTKPRNIATRLTTAPSGCVEEILAKLWFGIYDCVCRDGLRLPFPVVWIPLRRLDATTKSIL
jgi:hypothetical protein